MIKSRRKLPRRNKRFYRINQSIQASKVRVVDDQGKQIGVISLQEALEKAREAGFDLVEIAPKAKPPVCKIIDFKKFRFQEAKKEAKARKKGKGGELKEVRLTPFIAENDLKFRLKRAEEFLKDKHKVKIGVKFKGRQMGKKDFGYKLIETVIGKLQDLAEVETEPKFVGRRLEMVLRPATGEKSESKKET